MDLNVSPANSSPAKPGKPKEPSLTVQLAADLTLYLKQFPNRNFAIRILARESGLNEKTIRRLLSEQNKPTYQTIFKLYSIFHDEIAYERLLGKCPPVIRKYLKDFSPAETVSHQGKENQLLEILKAAPISAELFVLAGTGALKLGQVDSAFGQYGRQILERLLKADLLVEVSKNTYTLSPRIPNLDGQALKALGEYFVKNFSLPRATMGENTIAFGAEGLNEEGLKAWLSIDREGFYKKLEIAKDPRYRGDKKVFSFTATDLIQRNYP